MPGIPVFHSRDLVERKLIGHVVDRYGQLGTELPTNGGAWHGMSVTPYTVHPCSFIEISCCATDPMNSAPARGD